MSEDKKEQEKVGIKDTLEIVDFLNAYAQELKEHQEDDGMIDGAEALAALAETSDKGLAAAIGSWNMPKELKDLDDKEKEQLLESCLILVGNMAELFLNIELEDEEEDEEESA